MDPQFTEVERRWEALRDMEAGEAPLDDEDLWRMETVDVKRLERGK